jgi:hypothetical protein
MKRADQLQDQPPHSEGSGVRARAENARSSDHDIPSSRDVRLAHKLAEAEALLKKLGAQDERQRLLQMAVQRKDEGLLDAILSTLREK